MIRAGFVQHLAGKFCTIVNPETELPTAKAHQTVQPVALLGVDTGGTFTDFVLMVDGALQIHKVLSTPITPESAILCGVGELGCASSPLEMVHGSTVATNAVLEGKGVRTVFVTNRGLGDLLTLGRQARQRLYDLQPPLVSPPVAPECCLETGGRLAADGAVVEPLTDADLAQLRNAIANLAPAAVAINLLFSFRDPTFEQMIAAALPTDLFVSCSSEVLPEYREYERGIATWLNAYIGPLVAGYIKRLRDALPQANISVMQSSGGTVAADQAGEHAVRMLLSGPAGGLVGAQYVAKRAGIERIMTFDMGGTSSDVALIDGEIKLTSEGRIADYPVSVPMVDMHTIGAGGGSIASVDAGGMLRVGPESAGAAPGPACYGQGGTMATVTDANLVLGRLRTDAFLGGRMALDEAAAAAVLSGLGEAMGCSAQAAAEGVIDLANEHMAAALRVISLERGHDPRAFTLTSFGGAGGLHVCALAERLGMRRGLVPVHAGVLSALGMLVSSRSRDLSQTVAQPLASVSEATTEQLYASLLERAAQELCAEGVATHELSASRSADLRYEGQSYTLNLPWVDPVGTSLTFHAAHLQRFGHSLDAPVELVNVRLRAQGPAPQIDLPRVANRHGAASGGAHLAGIGEVSVYQRSELGCDQEIAGPALVVEQTSTTLLAPGWVCRVDAYGNLLLQQP
jgi:N-methylhydantoinase A